MGPTMRLFANQQAIPHGPFGEMKFRNTLYQGSFKNGIRSGYGRIKYINGDILYCQFSDEAVGMGLKIFHDNSVYFGQFKNSKKHGVGFIYKDLNSKNAPDKLRIRMKYYANKVDEM